jgi:uridine kinase
MEAAGMIDANPEQQNPYVVSLCGPSNAGKSQLAKAVAGELGTAFASRVPADYFLVPRPEMVSLEVYLTQSMRWDWDLLRDRIALPAGTRTSAPDVDFVTFQRRADDGGLPLIIRPVMICDAMEPYPRSDLVVLLEVPHQVRRARVEERDRRWGTVVADRWQHLEDTWRTASKDLIPDLVLDGTAPLGMLASSLSQTISGLFRQNEPAGKEK